MRHTSAGVTLVALAITSATWLLAAGHLSEGMGFILFVTGLIGCACICCDRLR
jgi:hypothetical protein